MHETALLWCYSTGDIQELYHVKLKPGHAAAFASDCDLPETHEMVRSVGMQVCISVCMVYFACILHRILLYPSDWLQQTTYMGFLDYRKDAVRELGINPSECTFNPGVFVADVVEWKKQKITKQLEKWMTRNFRRVIF